MAIQPFHQTTSIQLLQLNIKIPNDIKICTTPTRKSGHQKKG